MSQIPELSDKELLDLLKRDDNAAFTEIYRRYAETLASFAAARLFHLDDAEDILHDIFVKLWEDRHHKVITGELKSYLFSATRYRIIDKIRKNVVRYDYSQLIQATGLGNAHSGDQLLEAKELQENIGKLLNELPARTREIYGLSRNDQLSILEIAKKLNISEQTVKNQLTTALKHLRKSIISIGLLIFYFKNL